MDIRLVCRIVFPTLFPVILDTDSVICNESIMFFLEISHLHGPCMGKLKILRNSDCPGSD